MTAAEDEHSVVFVIGKGLDGSEFLSKLTTTGKLPSVAAKYSDAEVVYHHVSGLESDDTVVRDVSKSLSEHQKAFQITLAEMTAFLNSENQTEQREQEDEKETTTAATLLSKTAKMSLKRANAMKEANVLVVSVNSMEDPAAIDSAVVNTIESELFENVILTGIRSVEEVKFERYNMSKQRMNIMEKKGEQVMTSRRRRLEQEDQGAEGQQQQDDAQAFDNDQDMTGVYYVAMTPNILAGLLFGLLFVVITYIGVTCMGAIQGQDVFVSKMPSVGREA